MAGMAELITVLAAAIVALAMLSLAALKAWQDWLELRRMELNQKGRDRTPSPGPARLELADLKDRVKRLEAIADGIDDQRAA